MKTLLLKPTVAAGLAILCAAPAPAQLTPAEQKPIKGARMPEQSKCFAS